MTHATALAVCDLRKGYALGDSRVEVLHGISLALPRGLIAAAVGPRVGGNGSLPTCVAGIEPADQGSISIAGRRVDGLSDDQRAVLRRREIGVIFQFFNLVANLTVRENVGLPFLIDGEAPDQDKVTAMLERVGMRKRQDHLPSQLSGGEMQLVSIARALVRGPTLLCADEPTGNVNVETGRRIMALLSEVARGTNAAMLLVTHHPEDAARADRVFFMRDGALLPDAELTGSDVNAGNVHDRLKTLGI